jgi:hypothetical protein
MTERPLTLIQDLHARQQCLQAALEEALEALVALQAHEADLQGELQEIAALLARYELPTAAGTPADAPEADAPPLPSVPEAEASQEPVTLADARDGAMTLNEGQAEPPLPVTLAAALDAILDEHGPSSAAHLLRMLATTFGLQVVPEALDEQLITGKRARKYVQKKKLWSLA